MLKCEQNQQDTARNSKRILSAYIKKSKKLSELISEYGVSKAAINSWIRNIKEIPTDNGTIIPLELRKLQAKIRNLEQENDILKKLSLYLQKVTIRELANPLQNTPIIITSKNYAIF